MQTGIMHCSFRSKFKNIWLLIWKAEKWYLVLSDQSPRLKPWFPQWENEITIIDNEIPFVWLSVFWFHSNCKHLIKRFRSRQFRFLVTLKNIKWFEWVQLEALCWTIGKSYHLYKSCALPPRLKFPNSGGRSL